MKQQTLKLVNTISFIILLFFYLIMFTEPYSIDVIVWYQIIILSMVVIVNYIYSKINGVSNIKFLKKLTILYTIGYLIGTCGYSFGYHTSLLKDPMGLFFTVLIYFYGLISLIIIFGINIILWKVIIKKLF